MFWVIASCSIRLGSADGTPCTQQKSPVRLAGLLVLDGAVRSARAEARRPADDAAGGSGDDAIGGAHAAYISSPPPRVNRLQPQHLLHAVKAGRLADQPTRGAHRALGIDRPVAGAVRQFQPLADAGEDHLVVADRIAATQRGKADR